MIIVEPQAEMAAWLGDKLSRVFSPHLRCVGRRTETGIVGVVGLDDWDDCSAQIHVAGEGNWVSREFLAKVFHYAFVQSGLNVLYGLIPEGNTRSLVFSTRAGFRIQHRIPDAHRSGALVLTTLHRSECRYLPGEDTNGQVRKDPGST